MRALGGKNCRSNVKPGIHTGDKVEFNTVDFVAGVYGAKATQSTLSTFNKVDRVEFNFVAYFVPGITMSQKRANFGKL